MFSPLRGRRVLITRPEERAIDFRNKLLVSGAIPVLFPTIRIEPMADLRPLELAIAGLSTYDWVVFTSVNGVRSFWDRFSDTEWPTHVKVGAVGPATSEALSDRGVLPAPLPDRFLAQDLAQSLGSVSGMKILLPLAAIARNTLARALTDQGAIVHQIATYQTLPTHPEPAALAEVERGGDFITFTSSSTARNFVEILKRAHIALPHTCAVACIGPITAATVRELGLKVSLVASVHTSDGLISVMESFLTEAAPSPSAHTQQFGR